MPWKVFIVLFFVIIEESLSNRTKKGKVFGKRSNNCCENCKPPSNQRNRIDCSGLNLTQMPYFNSPYTNSNVKWYNLERNAITNLSKEKLKQYPNLEHLFLSNNKISEIPVDVFLNNKKLKTIDLSNNRITYIPEEMFNNCLKLSRLNLSNNRISNIPEDVFKNCLKLSNLDLSNNRISNVPEDVFKNCLELSWLNLRNNNISLIPKGVFNNTQYLDTIDLSNNRISNIPENVFNNCLKLSWLDLSYNRITYIPEHVFKNCLKLFGLNLKNNSIPIIPVGVFKYTQRLMHLETSGLADCCNAYRMRRASYETCYSFRCNDKCPPYKDCGVRLASKNQTSENRTSVGVVEVYEEDGKWKIICDKTWTKADSDVTCKDMGFIGAIENLSSRYNFTEHKIISNKDHTCTGKEKYLIECPSNDVDTNSDCLNIAGVRCKDEGKLLCKVCDCKKSYVNCSAKGLYHMPWTKKKFGLNITSFTISHNKIQTIWRGLLDSFPALEYLLVYKFI